MNSIILLMKALRGRADVRNIYVSISGIGWDYKPRNRNEIL